MYTLNDLAHLIFRVVVQGINKESLFQLNFIIWYWFKSIYQIIIFFECYYSTSRKKQFRSNNLWAKVLLPVKQCIKILNFLFLISLDKISNISISADLEWTINVLDVSWLAWICFMKHSFEHAYQNDYSKNLSQFHQLLLNFH